MSSTTRVGRSLGDIVARLERFAPLSLAGTWDNVGLLVDPMTNKSVTKMLLTNDLTEDVVEEAIGFKAGLIVSYHPNIFQPIKTVNSRSWKERIVIRCLQNDIAVFSPHTSWDCVEGGVNDWLASAFDTSSVKAVQPQDPNNPIVGFGRICQLRSGITLQDAVESVKRLTGLKHLRLAVARGKTINDTISSVAVCAGSGTSVLKDANANLYVTGEMLHHDILHATQRGTHVILCNHSDSERGFLKHIRGKLQDEVLENEVDVCVSDIDCDPLTTV